MAAARENTIVRFMARRRTLFAWLIPVIIAILAYFYGHRHMKLFAVGVVLLVLGEIMRFWAAGTIYKDDTVATGGPYSFVRNPLYFGSLLLAIGYSLMSGLHWIAWVVTIALFAAFHLAAIATEEAFLKTKFGEPYLEYIRHVPRLIPRPLPYRTEGAAPASFSWQQVVYNREPTTATVTALAAVVFGVIQFLHHS